MFVHHFNVPPYTETIYVDIKIKRFLERKRSKVLRPRPYMLDFGLFKLSNIDIDILSRYNHTSGSIKRHRTFRIMPYNFNNS